MDSEEAKRIYKKLKKAICDKQSLARFKSCTKYFMPFEWCNRWKKKKGKNKKGLFEQVKGKKYQLEDLILKILAVAMDQGMDKGLQEQAKKKE